MARITLNPFRRGNPDWSAPELAFLDLILERAARPLHRALPGYQPSPLLDLPDLATELGLGAVLVKDESGRFGIQAFKGLGASFAVYSVLKRRWRERTGHDLPPSAFRDAAVRDALGEVVFTAATDGNHGRAVAWTARMLGQKAVIFLPADTAAARIAHIEAEGAEARLIDGTFDDCVTACAASAAKHGWQVIADTAYPGFMEVPGFIMTGYSTIFTEIAEQLDAPLDFVVLPAGVGGLAAAGAAYHVQTFGDERPQLICVEPEESACFLESILAGDGRPHPAAGSQRSIMAGLNCGIPSLLAWPLIRDAMDLFLAVEDTYAEQAMRLYHRHGVESGESGASTLAGLLALLQAPELSEARDASGLGPRSRVLLINTEGATDPDNYARIIEGEPAS